MPRTRRGLSCDYCQAETRCSIVHAFGLHDGSDELAEVRAQRDTREYRRQEMVYRAGERPAGLWLLCSGRVKTYRMNADGKVFITGIVSPGEWFGLPALLADQTYETFAEAMEMAVVARWRPTAVRRWLSKSPAFSAALLQRLAQQTVAAETRAANLVYWSARERVADALQMLAVRDGASLDPVVEIRRQDLAELTGLTVETTVRTLKALERSGDVRLQGRKIVVRGKLGPRAAGTSLSNAA